MDVNRWYYLDVQETTNSHDFARKTNTHEYWTDFITPPDWTALEK